MRLRNKKLSPGIDEVACRRLMQEFDRALDLYNRVADKLLTSDLTLRADRFRVEARLQARARVISQMILDVESSGFNQDPSEDPI